MNKIAFVFPGQGSQAVGMGDFLAEGYPEVRTLYERATQVLGWDLLQACKEGPEERLKQTDVAQPALFVTGYAAYTVLKTLGVTPDAVAGHSIGEYAALAAANVIGFGEGLGLVRERARLMHEAGQKKPGAMAAILGLSADAVRDLCAQAASDGICVPVNFNTPEQIVIAGEKAAIEKACALAAAAGAKRAIVLNVSGAFHSPLMEEAADAMKERMARVSFEQAAIPVAMNVDGQLHTDARDISGQLALQLDHPVEWVQCIQALKALGCTTFVECGAGRVLSGLIKRIDKQLQTYSTETKEALELTAQALIAARKEQA
jgi:[acyl-carrier-protein] S-malonyltransferase